MHNLPRFFTRRNNSSGPMDPRRRGKATTRRLERRNATKHIDYDVASSCSSGEDLSVSPSTSALVTRSLELPDRTSFRIEGVEGEMDRICRSLGLSGPDDFAIPPAAWEASKARCSSDILPRLRSMRLDSLKNLAEEAAVSEVDSSRAVAGSSSGDRDDRESTRPELTELNDFGDCSASGGGEFTDRVMGGGGISTASHIDLTRTGMLEPGEFSVAAVGGGIKGLRPPVLKPPPRMRLPEIDHTCSSWDFLRDFAPESGAALFSEANKRPVSTSSSENGSEEEEAEEEEEEEEAEAAPEMRIDRVDRREEANVLQLGDTADEACSFTTNECDSSSTMSNPSPNYPSERPITSWQKGQLLGRGSFGSVYEGIAGDGDFFAVKEVSLLEQGSQAQECIQQLEQEIALLSQLKHENIVRYRGTDKDGSNLYIFLELVTQGSLLSLYKRYRLMDSIVSAYTRQILHGLNYLHDQGFIHRDIKCANILVDASGFVKLTDFGLAKVTKLNDIKSCKGTPFWMAPEVINRKTNDGYGRPADIWSLGCTVLEMLTGQIPYSDLEPVQALFRIGRGVLPSVPDALSTDARDFILECLKVNPDERPTASQLLNHPFVWRPLPTPSGSASPHLQRSS